MCQVRKAGADAHLRLREDQVKRLCFCLWEETAGRPEVEVRPYSLNWEDLGNVFGSKLSLRDVCDISSCSDQEASIWRDHRTYRLHIWPWQQDCRCLNCPAVWHVCKGGNACPNPRGLVARIKLRRTFAWWIGNSMVCYVILDNENVCDPLQFSNPYSPGPDCSIKVLRAFREQEQAFGKRIW